MTGRTEAVLIIAGHELRAALRGRMIPAFAALFAALAIVIALAGLAGSGRLLVQGFTRTSVSLLTLGLYLLPLLGALLGAAAFSADDGGTELLLAQPITRSDALLGRTLGLAAALAMVSLAGFGAAAVLVVARAGGGGFGGFAFVALASTLVAQIGLAIGVLIGVRARRRGAAVGWALACWFAAAVLYDIASIAALQLAGNGQPGPWLLALLAANPIDGLRALGLVRLGADVLLGPTGAALQRLLGGAAGATLVVASPCAGVVTVGAEVPSDPTIGTGEMMRMEKNIGPADQLIRTIVAIGAFGLVLAGIASGTLGLLLVIVGVVFAVTAALWFCPLYRVLGINTCRTVQPR